MAGSVEEAYKQSEMSSGQSSDPERTETIKKFLHQLESSQSQIVYKCLVEIRTKFAGSDYQKAKNLVSHGLVSKLVPLLERPNSKIVDVTLSILGNLTLHRKPRDKVTFVNISKCVHNSYIVILFSWFCNFCRKEFSLIFKHYNFWEVPDELNCTW